jgi:hypothetical protein
MRTKVFYAEVFSEDPRAPHTVHLILRNGRWVKAKKTRVSRKVAAEIRKIIRNEKKFVRRAQPFAGYRSQDVKRPAGRRTPKEKCMSLKTKPHSELPVLTTADVNATTWDGLLDLSLQGKTFRYESETFKFVAYNHRARTYPVVVRRSDGTLFKASAPVVAHSFQASWKSSIPDAPPTIFPKGTELHNASGRVGIADGKGGILPTTK